MNIEIFKRNVQLHKLGITELESSEQKIYQFLIDNLTGLCIYTSDKKPNYLYFGKSQESIVLSYNYIDNYLLISSDNIWHFFSDFLYIQYEDMHSLMRWWMEVILDLKLKDITKITTFELINMD